MMPNDTRELPASNDGLSRFLGGSPLAVAFRLILLSILVGVVLAAIGFDPWNILHSIRMLFQRLWDLGFDAINWLWRYFLLGAVIVIPIWLLMRIFGTPRGRELSRQRAAADATSIRRLRRCVRLRRPAQHLFSCQRPQRQFPDRLRGLRAAGAQTPRHRARRYRSHPDHAFPRRSFWRIAVLAARRAIHAADPAAGDRRAARDRNAGDHG